MLQGQEGRIGHMMRRFRRVFSADMLRHVHLHSLEAEVQHPNNTWRGAVQRLLVQKEIFYVQIWP